MVCRVARVTAGGTRGLVAVGAVEPSGRAAAATVETVEAPRAIGCGTGGGRIKSQEWPKPEAVEQRRRQKSWGGSEPETAVQRKR